ncbi:17562_t:CDS:1, partial [Dentiscutata erythropus]
QRCKPKETLLHNKLLDDTTFTNMQVTKAQKEIEDSALHVIIAPQYSEEE